MMFFGFVEFLSIMMLVGANGTGSGDLLDYADSGTYWQQQAAIKAEREFEDADGFEDEDEPVEIEAVPVTIAGMSKVLNDKDAGPGDRLMAIRTLGELGKADDADPATKAKILKLLAPLVGSEEAFVDGYAKRSIAWIKGEEVAVHPKSTIDMIDMDLALLPKSCNIVAQARMSNGVGPVDWLKLIPSLGPDGDKVRQNAINEIQQGLGMAIAELGNVRLDAFTLGVDAQDNGGSGMIVARGKYDPIHVTILLEKQNEEAKKFAEENEEFNGGRGQQVMAFYSIGEIEVVSMTSEYMQFAMLMPSDEVFVMLFNMGGFGGNVQPLPIAETAKRMAQGLKTPTLNEMVAAQVAKIDRTKADAWVAMEVPKMLRNEQEPAEYFGPFSAGRIVAMVNPDGSSTITVVADGQGAEKIAAVKKLLDGHLAEAKEEIQEEMADSPDWMKQAFTPLVKMVDSIKLTAGPNSLSGTMQMPGGLQVMMPMFMQNSSYEEEGDFERGGAGDAPNEAEAAEEVAPAKRKDEKKGDEKKRDDKKGDEAKDSANDEAADAAEEALETVPAEEAVDDNPF